MSPQTSAKALSPASPPTLIAQQETASSADGKPSSTASTEVSIHQQQTVEATNVVEDTMSSNFQAPSLNHLQHSDPSDPTEDQLPKLITGPDDSIRQSKLIQDPKREAVKHTLLQEELAQVREENLNLRIDLQLARENHQSLESEHHECKRRKKKMGKAMKKAIKNLSRGLGPPEEGSAGPEVTTGGVVADVSLPLQQPNDNSTVQKSSSTLSPFQAEFTGSTGGGTPIQAPFFGQSLMKNTSLGFFGSRGVNKPLSSVTGDPVRMIQPLDSETLVILSTPGYHNDKEQSFEEARLRRYELSKIKPVAAQTPKGSEGFGNFQIPIPHKSFNRPSLPELVAQQSKKRKIENDADDREGPTPGSTDVAGANQAESSQPAGSQGAGIANMTPAISNIGFSFSAPPFSKV